MTDQPDVQSIYCERFYNDYLGLYFASLDRKGLRLPLGTIESNGCHLMKLCELYRDTLNPLWNLVGSDRKFIITYVMCQESFVITARSTTGDAILTYEFANHAGTMRLDSCCVNTENGWRRSYYYGGWLNRSVEVTTDGYAAHYYDMRGVCTMTFNAEGITAIQFGTTRYKVGDNESTRELKDNRVIILRARTSEVLQWKVATGEWVSTMDTTGGWDYYEAFAKN